MMRLPRFLPCVALACSLTIPTVLSRPAYAQEAAPPAATQKAGEPSKELVAAVDDFWHYAKIARYNLAAAAGQKVLELKAQPLEALQAFERVAAQHNDTIDDWINRWQGVKDLSDTAAKLQKLIAEGRYARRSDPKYITANIDRLGGTTRGFALAVEDLRNSGELAYPSMINYLRDPAKRELHLPIRRALVELGRVGLNPLAAATEMRDATALTYVATVLGELGYDVSVPYLAKVAQDKSAPQSAREAAKQAIIRLGGSADVNVGEAFYGLAEKFYYGNASLIPDPRNPTAYVWMWDDAKGLQPRPVPPVIFNDVMAMRTSKEALGADGGMGKAVSLWLAANYKREADLPDGATDPTAPANSAHFYGVSAGAQYLNDVVKRGLNDRNSAVALRSIKSLEEIAGQSNLFTGGQPILDALAYNDRQVRFESSFAVAAALPQQSFANAERVVPILGEALSQTGKPAVLVVAPAEALKQLKDGLAAAGYAVEGESDPALAVQRGRAMSGVDVVVFSDKLSEPQIASLLSAVGESAQLQGAGLVVMSETRATPWARYAVVTTAADAAGMKAQLEEARAKTGGLPLDEKTATGYAMRAAELLQKLAINRNPVLNLSLIEPTLLRSLDDPRAELVKASAGVLGLLNSAAAQAGLLGKATDEKAAEDVRIAAFKSLATNAKRYGNQLSNEQVGALTQAVASASAVEVKAAAAEARGALNLQADEAAALILGKAPVAGAAAPTVQPAGE